MNIMTPERDFYAIGHITNDTEPTPHIGGGVTYTSIGLQLLGYQTHVITKCPPQHPYIQELENFGVSVHVLPSRDTSRSNSMTSFKNFYDTQGHREQVVPEVQESITQEDISSFPRMPDGSIVLIAPVISEVDPSLITAMAKEAHVVVTPQGYFRQRQTDGKVKRVPWDDIDALSSAKVVMFSDEDLTSNGVFNDDLLQRIRKLCPLAIMTEGSNGATIFHSNTSNHMHPFSLSDEELHAGDFTGAGDTCAAGFIANYFQTGNAEKATAFGMLYAALKIAGAGGHGIGITTIPTRQQVQAFEDTHQERMRAFLDINGIDSLMGKDKEV